MSKYSELQGNHEDNLKIIKIFYTKVWGSYEKYVQNDKVLYSIFLDEKKCEPLTKAVVLNNFYSAGMFADQAEEFAEHIKLNHNDNELGKKKYRGKKPRRLLSMESKYVHWYAEVNGGIKRPIYDKNVREVLNYYKKNDGKPYLCFENKKNRSCDYKELNEAIDDFNSEKFGKDGNSSIEIDHKIDNIPKIKSLYRLVDKFLWLQYKIENGKVPKPVKTKFENFLRRVECLKKKKIKKRI